MGERGERAPGLGYRVSGVLCSVPLLQAGQGRRDIHQRALSLHPFYMHTYKHTHIPLAFEKRSV